MLNTSTILVLTFSVTFLPAFGGTEKLISLIQCFFFNFKIFYLTFSIIGWFWQLAN
jgi:hypothetical protein